MSKVSLLKRFARRLPAMIALPLLVTSGVGHSAVVFESGADSVPLVELFTSEGCNSCPPADAWLSSLRTMDGLWSHYVPVAFHVTYWDSLGWSDRFGQQKFDTLHESTAAYARAPVYTPGVFVAGKEWRSWLRAPLAFNELPDKVVGILRVEVDDSMASVTFGSREPLTQPNVALAWLESNQTTQVRRGENAGKSLHHEFVARALRSAPLQLTNGIWRASVPVTDADSAASQALAIWVTDSDGKPVQATGGWLRAPNGP